MAGYYKFRIEKKEGYVFRLYPNNNNNQCIGESIEYPSETMCKNALEELKSEIKHCRDVDITMIINSNGECDYLPCILISGETRFLRLIPYSSRNQCVKWLKRVKKNINAVLL